MPPSGTPLFLLFHCLIAALSNTMLTDREREGIHAVIKMNMQSALDRGNGNMSVTEAATGIYEAAQLMLRRMREDLQNYGPQDVLGLRAQQASDPLQTIESSSVMSQTPNEQHALVHQLEVRAASPPSSPAKVKRRRFDVAPDEVEAHRLPRSSLATEAPSNVILNILGYLIDPPDTQGRTPFTSWGHFTALTYASHVCTSWRRVADSSPDLWSDLHTMSTNELDNLDVLLRRSHPRSIRRLAIHFVTPRKFNFVRACAAIAWHMDRIEDLQLTMSNRQIAVFYALKGALIESMAPRLKRFSIDFEVNIVFSSNLFSGTAPYLSHIALHSPQVPKTDRNLGLTCRAFRGVKSAELLDDIIAPKYEALQLLCGQCPKLEDLTMRLPLLDAPTKDVRWSPPALRKLKISEAPEDTTHGEAPHSLMLRTLDLLQHRHIAYLNVGNPHPDTVRKVLGVLPVPSNLTIIAERHAGYIALEASLPGVSLTRVFSNVRPAELEHILRFIATQPGWLANLSSLSLGLYALHKEWEYLNEVLGGGSLSALKQLTLHAPPVSPPYETSFAPINIFEYSISSDGDRMWRFPRLKTLYFVARTGADVVEPHWQEAATHSPATATLNQDEISSFLKKHLVGNDSAALTGLSIVLRGARFADAMGA